VVPRLFHGTGLEKIVYLSAWVGFPLYYHHDILAPLPGSCGHQRQKSNSCMTERQQRYLARCVKKAAGNGECNGAATMRNASNRRTGHLAVAASSGAVAPPPSMPVQAHVTVPIQVPANQVNMPPLFQIKYSRFRGDGTQDVDDSMEQYLATLAANDEGDEDTTKRLFRGLIDGEALRWYNSLDVAVRGDWSRLRAAFEQEFREIGADSRVMARLNSIKMKPTDTLRSYTQKIQQLIGKLSTPPPANL
jgi:hypothetical protein